MRWAILGSVTACTGALVILLAITGPTNGTISFVSSAYDRVTAVGRQDEDRWQERELTFLKSIHDRIQIELRHQSDGAASLQKENRLILEAMAEVAKTMSSDNVPADVKMLVADLDLKTSLGLPPESGEGPSTSVHPAPLATAAAAIDEVSIETSVVLAPTPTSEPPQVRPQISPPQTKLEDTLHTEKTDRGLRIRVPADALFGTERDTLDAADPSLSKALELIRAMQPREIIVLGHTDASKTPAADLALSKERARAVSNWLKAHGVDDQRDLIARGYGGSRPIAPNENADGSDNPTGRTQNRRIEILLRRH